MSIVPFTPTTWNPGAAPGIEASQLNRIEDALEAIADGVWTGGTFVMGTAPNRVTVQVTSGGNLDIELENSPAAAFRFRLSDSGLVIRHPTNETALTFTGSALQINDGAGNQVAAWSGGADEWTFTPAGGSDGLKVAAAQVELVGTQAANTDAEAGTVRRIWVGESGTAIGGLGADGDVWIGHQGAAGNPGVAVKVAGTWKFAAGG